MPFTRKCRSALRAQDLRIRRPDPARYLWLVTALHPEDPSLSLLVRVAADGGADLDPQEGGAGPGRGDRGSRHRVRAPGPCGHRGDQDSRPDRDLSGPDIVPLIGNAAEHATAIVVARKGKMDLALQIALGSSTQVALLVAPILVFAGVLLGRDMNLAFTPFEILALGWPRG